MEKTELRLLKEWTHGDQTFKVGEQIVIEDEALYKTLTEGDEPLAVDIAKEAEEYRAQEKARLDAEEKERKEKEKASKSVVTRVHERSVDAPMWGYGSVGEFALGVKGCGTNPLAWDPRLRAAQEHVKAASGMNEFQDSEGALLIPDEMSMTIRERVYAENNLITRTESGTTSGNSMSYLMSSETSRATGSRWGGFRGYWLDEAGQKQESKPTFDKMTLKLKKNAILCYVTDELLDDAAVALGPYLTNGAGREINFMVSDAIINGTGQNQPLGILLGPCLVSVGKETNQAARTIVSENVIKMYARMWSGSIGNSVWLTNQNTFSELVTMVMSVGSGGVPLYMPPGGLSVAPFGTIFGRPVIPTEWNPTLGTVGDLMLVDLSQYLTLTKGAIQAAMSIHLRFDYDETAFRFVFRVDGMPAWKASLTPYKDSSSTQPVSPFVALDTRA